MRRFLPSFQPVERHGRTQVSGRASGGSGPSWRSRSRTSRRHASLSRTQSCSRWCHSFHGPAVGHAAISARNSAASSAGLQPAGDLDQPLGGDRVVQVAGAVRLAEPGPQDQLRGRRHRARLVERQHRQPPGRVEQVRRRVASQQGGAHRDRARLVTGQEVSV